MTSPLSPITADEITEARRLDAAATPGPWETDHERTEDGYGQYKTAVLIDSNGGVIVEFSNSDIAEIYTEGDEDGTQRWDEVAYRNAALIKVARNLLPRLLSEREPVGDGEVAEALAILANFVGNEDPETAADEIHALALLRRLARQCAEQRVLLDKALVEVEEAADKFWVAHCNHPGDALGRSQGEDKAFLSVMSARMGNAAKLIKARRDALLNQESGK